MMVEAIELSTLSEEERGEVLAREAAKGIHIARVGDLTQHCGGPGQITVSPVDVTVRGCRVAVIGATSKGICAHGCPACEHQVRGPVITGHASVTAGGRPVATVGSTGVHSACCGPNEFEVLTGFGKGAPSPQANRRRWLAVR